VRHALVIVAFAASAIVTAACGGDSTGPDTPKTPVGAYSLTSVNGKTMPVAIYSDTNYLVTLSDASLSLAADGNYQSVRTERETIGGHVSVYVDTTTGTWIQGTGAGALVFTDKFDGRKVTAVWSGFTITLSDTAGGTTTSAVYTRK
jgi:hypothetical protein